MKLGWYIHRLRAMTLSELAHRVTERWRHRSDAAFAKSVRGIELGAAVEGVIPLPVRDAAPVVLKQTLARDAASLMRGDWKLFGWRKANVGTPPRWHCDVTCGVVIPADGLAHRLDHRALPGGADVRTIWEINRWSEMVRLAMHGWLNDDIKAVRVAVGWLEDWCDKNPVGYGVNWTSPLEAGLRLVNFAWLDSLVERSLCALQRVQGDATESLSVLKRAQRALAERIVPAHAAWVWRYRSFGSSANNHLLGELVGLLHAVKRWPSLERVTCSAEELWREISRCVMEQFAEDGGNKEQALHYHLFAWEMAWHAARLMGVNDGPVLERLRKAVEFFVQVAHDGEQWEYGDNDDAQIVPVTLEREHAVAEWKGWMRGRVGAGSVGYWLGDLGLTESENAGHAWWLAPGSGMAVCERDGWKVRLDASPLGFGSMAAHGHCDALHVSLWDGPHALVIDPGTGGYYGMKQERAELAAWEAHNGPQPVGGLHAPQRMGVFLWARHHAVPSLGGDASQGITAHLGHEGYDATRHVACCEGGQIIVRDAMGVGRAFTVRWRLSPECAVTSESSQGFLIKRHDRVWCVNFVGERLRCEVLNGSASRRYGEFEKCVVIAVTAEALLTTTWSRI